MRRLYDWLKSYFSLRRMISKCDKKSKKLHRDLNRRKKSLDVLEGNLRKLSRAISEDIQNTEDLLTNSERSLEAVQSRLVIAEDVTIPALVQSNKLLLERSSADTAEQVRRQLPSQRPKYSEE